MESKIEKIEVNSFTGVNDGVYLIIQKINEFIDYLNSQAQPVIVNYPINSEVQPEKRYAYTYKETPEGTIEHKIKLDTKPQDTPEEWEEEIRSLIDGQQLKGVKPYTGDYERLVCAIKQLLTEREMRAYSDGYTDGITRCMNSLDKLNKKK